LDDWAPYGLTPVRLRVREGDVQVNLVLLLDVRTRPAIYLHTIPPVVLHPGEKATQEVRLERLKCAGLIEFAVEGMRDGVRATISPLSPGKTTAWLEMEASAGAKPGVAELTVRARHGATEASGRVLLGIRE